jgi:PhnB protein
MSLGLTLYVEHGREQEAADFYAAAFGGRVQASQNHLGQMIAVDLVIGGTPGSVAGAKPF